MQTVNACGLSMHVETRWRSQRECLQAASAEQRLEAQELALILGRRRARTTILPVWHLPTQMVFGVQTLVRGPAGGPLQRSRDLYRAARDLGRMGELDMLCVERALEASGLVSEQVAVFVRVSSSHLSRMARTHESIDFLACRCGCHPSRVVFEVNVDEMPEEEEHRVGSLMESLRKRGFRFAVDSFATGKSLSLLSTLPEPDFIKLPSVLVRGIDSDLARRNLARGIIDVASNCGAKLIAGNVERRQEEAALRMLGASLFQGPLYGPGLTA